MIANALHDFDDLESLARLRVLPAGVVVTADVDCPELADGEDETVPTTDQDTLAVLEVTIPPSLPSSALNRVLEVVHHALLAALPAHRFCVERDEALGRRCWFVMPRRGGALSFNECVEVHTVLTQLEEASGR